jgi:putative acyl-CoA dehydrogenase
MAPLRPLTQLATHRVFNQTPPLEEADLFAADPALRFAVEKAGGAAHAPRLHALGARAGSAEVQEWGRAASRFPPELEAFDALGQRLDEVRFHPAYHALMRLGLEAGVAALPWQGTPAGHVAHAALLSLIGEADPGPTCPMSMTYAAVPALRAEPEVAAEWLPRLLAARYDPRSSPAAEKEGVTIGMAMTEKQGGSDVRAITTTARPAGEPGWYALEGHKWFCSAPMSDAFLTLAQTAEGLSCFLLPRWLPDGTRNAGFSLVRLKDKLGDRANASAEVEYRGALARLLGPPGRGLSVILAMVQHTRLDCAVSSAQQMRSAVRLALWHALHRRAFGRPLIEQPLMRAVLADLVLEAEAATALAFRTAAAFDAAEPLARLLTPLAKYLICKRAPHVAAEAMECLGGNGYIETGPMPRLFRQSPLNAIWEGAGNVIALDVRRALIREAEGREALFAFLEAARGRDPLYDAHLAALPAEPPEEGALRFQAETLALAAAAATLLLWEHPAAGLFCRFRLAARRASFGAEPGLAGEAETLLAPHRAALAALIPPG